MKKKFGDRRDGKLIRKTDSMHIIMPLMYPNRCDNEAYVSETIDLTAMDAYLAEKNKDHPEDPYKVFHAIVTAMLKTITLRPKMNRFIANKKMYQRNEVTAAFTVKKVFEDESEEGLTFFHSKETDTIQTIHDEIYRQVNSIRSDHKDASTDSMDFVCKFPRFIIQGVGAGARFLDRHGWMPKSVVETDPYQSSCEIANLGSIKMKGGYHHLTNWGTTSIFCFIGEIKKRPYFDDEGHITMKNSVTIGLTIDERIADGYYYSKTVQLFKKLLEEPELLDQPLGEKVEGF